LDFSESGKPSRKIGMAFEEYKKVFAESRKASQNVERHRGNRKPKAKVGKPSKNLGKPLRKLIKPLRKISLRVKKIGF
jgi:hypothetical protein